MTNDKEHTMQSNNMLQIVEQLDDFKFMKKHFQFVSSEKQIENGTFGFIVKQNASNHGEDRVLVAYSSGYLRSSIYNHTFKQIALCIANTWHGGKYRVNVFNVMMVTQSSNKLEMYTELFARMRAYVEKHKLV